MSYMNKPPFVSLVEFIRSKLLLSFAHVHGMRVARLTTANCDSSDDKQKMSAIRRQQDHLQAIISWRGTSSFDPSRQYRFSVAVAAFRKTGDRSATENMKKDRIDNRKPDLLSLYVISLTIDRGKCIRFRTKNNQC